MTRPTCRGRRRHSTTCFAARPRDATATLGLGNLALIRHSFRQALVVGREARRLAPYSARPLGVIGDAQIELGRYPAAFASFERMVALKPNLASYSRIAYARELTGDTSGALAAMRLALDAAGGQPESAAWVEVELGKLEFGRGRLAAADRHYRAALTIFPATSMRSSSAPESRRRAAISRRLSPWPSVRRMRSLSRSS